MKPVMVASISLTQVAEPWELMGAPGVNETVSKYKEIERKLKWKLSVMEHALIPALRKWVWASLVLSRSARATYETSFQK